MDLGVYINAYRLNCTITIEPATMKQLLPLTALTALAFGQAPVSGPEYLALPAAEKQAIIWENTLMDSSSNHWPGLELGEIFFESMCITMEQSGDELPKAWTGNYRKKYIHSVGNVGKVEFVAKENAYTGIFKGAQYGIIRISFAAEPDENVLNTTPGMGLKFLRDGTESASLVAMYGVDGQASWNIFANDWSNHIAAAEGVALIAIGAKFATATPYIQQVGLSDFAMVGEDGVAETEINYPYKLIFRYKHL